MTTPDCEHENTATHHGKCECLDCGAWFIACRACYVLGSGVPVYHTPPECPITQEEWAAVIRKELEDLPPSTQQERDEAITKAGSVPLSFIRPQGAPITKETPIGEGGSCMLFDLLEPKHIPDKYQEKAAHVYTQFDLPDAYPELSLGNTKEVVLDGHIFHITAVRSFAIHSNRAHYMVECITCKRTVHPSTTGPQSYLSKHVKEPDRQF